MTTTLYPHEWLWQKMKKNNGLMCLISACILITLILGYIGSFLLMTSASGVPTTDAWNIYNCEGLPSSISYAPIFVIALLAVAMIYLGSISGRKSE